MSHAQDVVDPVLRAGTVVETASDVASVRAAAAVAARRQGLPPATVTLVERVATGMATLLVDREGTHHVLARALVGEGGGGVELLASTSGPTPFDTAALRDVVVAPDLFEVYSVPAGGTVMMAQLWGGDGPAHQPFTTGWMAEPIPGERVSGDACAVEQHGSRLAVLVADGLGHGQQAAVASAAAVSTFREHHRAPVEEIAARLHRELRSTRGAAIALAEVDRDKGELRFCGIGNVAARLMLMDGAHALTSRYGIAGYQAPQIRAVTRPWPDDAMLVLHTDGLSDRWSIEPYPRLHLQHPQLAAATVMRDATRSHDDALVVAVRGVDDAALPPSGGPTDG